MARSKPQVMTIEDLAQADAVLEELCRIGRKLGEIEAAMNEALDVAKAEAKKAAAPLAARKKELETALATFGAYNKADLFKKRRSVERAFGVFGFRKSTKLKLLSKFTWALVLQRLKELKLEDGIRIKEEVNKEALQTWPEERQETVGVKLDTSDEFFIELSQEKLKEEAA
ncbi:host-nuclease inhibitor Gam family protein [Desulfocurvibacter africanus]|uniref:host-nuclease inhibitor Gam family protein n=1 Tax=Desulfocurvibacter africanus TaxID=873 RepID=UPI0004812B30|nr:host-nuclease inhibitor Gam family protein [Desulfocurvibacter africanus]